MILQFPISDLRSTPNWMSFLREEAFFGPGNVGGFSWKLVVAFQPGMTLVAPFDGLLRRIVSVGEDPDSSPVVLEIQPWVYQQMLSLVDGFSGQLPRMRWYNVDRNAFESVLQTLIDNSEITATDPTQTVNKIDRFLSGEYSIFVERGTIIASNLVSFEIEIRSREGIAVDPIVYYGQYLAQENPEDDPLDDREWLTSLFPLLTRRSLVQVVNAHDDPLFELIRVQRPDGGIEDVNVSETEGMIVSMDFPTAEPPRVLIESIEIPEPLPDPMEQTADRYLLVSRWPSGGIEAAGQIVINSTSQPTFTRFVVTHLRDWFASQYVTNSSVRLPRYSFGNHVEALVDGNIALSKMYEDIKGITNAQPPNGQFYYLMGWSLTRLVPLKKGVTDSAFNDLMKEILNKEAKVRILLWDELHLGSEALRDTMAWALLLIFLLTVGGQALIPPLALVFFSILAAAIAGYGIFSSSELVRDFLSRSFEGNEESINGLNGEGIPAFLDGKVRETRTTGTSRLYDFIGSHHQKISVISGPTTTVAYCGGVDINGNRLDDPSHFVVHPYHDLHCRIIGPAAADITITMRQRWNDLHPDDPADDEHDGVLHADPLSTGTHVVQVARTYPNKINQLNESYPYAPDGDFTIRDTLLKAIRRARTYIYLEDQYLTAPADIKEALQDQLRENPQLRLIMVIPRASDQPENSLRRARFIGELLQEFHSDRVITLFPTKLVFPHDSVRHGPIETKLISEITISDTEIPVEDPSSFEEQGIILVDEEEIKYSSRDLLQRKLVIGSSGRRGHNNTHKTLHRQGAVVRQVKYRDIYVHPKTWIIDDIIATIGSANLNRRGMTHDSECNVFVMDGKTSRSGRSFAKSLRIELWAEHLGLHESVAARLMLDNPNEAMEFLISYPGPAGNRLRRYWAHDSELFPESWSGKLPNYWDVGLVEDDMWDTYIDPDGTRPLE